MKLLRTIQLDSSDSFVFERAAAPGEWAVSGAFAFVRQDIPALQGKARSAFRAGFLGLSSFGRSTLVQVADAGEEDCTAATERLAMQLVEQFGAPDLAAARVAAEEEIGFAASLCDHPPGVIVAVTRTFEAGSIRETYRSLRPGVQSPSRVFEFVEVVGEEAAPGEHLDLVKLASPGLIQPHRPADKPVQLTAEPHDGSPDTLRGGRELRSTALASISVGVVVERRRAKSLWTEFLWRPVSVLVGKPSAEPWTPLDTQMDATLIYAGTAVIELHRTETAYYRDNLAAGAPKLWVALRPTASKPPYQLLAVTANPAEGEALTDAGGDLVETVPMPSGIAETVGQFVTKHHVERAFMKRQRQAAEPMFSRRRERQEMQK